MNNTAKAIIAVSATAAGIALLYEFVIRPKRQKNNETDAQNEKKYGQAYAKTDNIDPYVIGLFQTINKVGSHRASGMIDIFRAV